MCVPSLLPPRTLRSRTDLLPLLPRAQGAGAWRTDFVSSGPVPDTVNTLHTAVRPVGISNVTAYEVSVMDIWPRSSTQWSNDTGASCLGDVLSTNASTASACYRLASSVPSDGKLDAVKYVGIASSDAFPGKEHQGQPRQHDRLGRHPREPPRRMGRRLGRRRHRDPRRGEPGAPDRDPRQLVPHPHQRASHLLSSSSLHARRRRRS